jgi:hypothetical protein
LAPQLRKQVLLKKAADLIGHAQLARQLNVSDSILKAWISGDATMPDAMLIALADALGKAAEAQQLPPIRR